MLDNHAQILKQFKITREKSLEIIEPLETEEMVVQPTAEVSPIKWHIGHTTWFFENFVLDPLSIQLKNGYEYRPIFNSYYKSVGVHWEQGKRGTLSKPTVKDIIHYRKELDEKIFNLSADNLKQFESIIIAGIHHEMQHQELMYMDIKYVKFNEVIKKPYLQKALPAEKKISEEWFEISEGLYQIGNNSDQFHFDNETSRHQVYLNQCKISKLYVTNGDFQEFILDGGYQKSNLWLSMGWDWVLKNNIKAPLYWANKNNEWFEHTLHGEIRLDPQTPLSHISFFEADAFARWKKCRLPTEAELEIFSLKNTSSVSTNFEQILLHPRNEIGRTNELWCWTGSQYTAYPGFKPFEGLLAEYNGKFMCNQFVLRGGCLATPKGHYRDTYRNFYLPHQRWMFSGIRLAKDGI